MHLFDKIPDNLFSILASKNKRIYLDALFVVRDAFRISLGIAKDDLVTMLISAMEDEIMALDMEEEQAEGSFSDLSGKANFLIRKLTEVKWIRQEFHGERFESMVTLPDYAIRLINVLYELGQEDKREYNSLVVSTYNNLKNADRERNEYSYQALERAVLDTAQLVDLLKSLYNNIGSYHQALLELSEVNDILEAHFDDFKATILDRFYHPLKTLDSVPRFKGPILTILNTWHQEREIKEMMVAQALKYGLYEDEAAAFQGIISKINSLLDAYESIPGIIEQIDWKNSAYTQATIEKVQYLVNRDQSIKGSLVRIIQGASENRLPTEAINTAVIAYRQRYAEPASLYARSNLKTVRMASPLKITTIDSAERDQAADAFRLKVEHAYSDERIRQYMVEQLKNGPVTSAQMPLDRVHDLMRLMLSSIRAGQKNMPFEAEFLDKWVENSGFSVPLITFKGRE